MPTNVDRGSFGPVLRRLRLAAGLSQEGLAELARLSVESVSALERGRRKAPYRDTIFMLADALNLSGPERDELSLAARRERRSAAQTVRFDSDPSVTTAAGAFPAAEPKHNLARLLNSFYDRTQEISDLTRLMQDHRLFSLVGAGGIGKTRIAIELGWKLIGGFTDGVWFIDLAQLSDHSVIAHTFFEVLRIPPDPGHDDIETLKHHLRGREALLIVDNCEHVVEQVAALLEGLLQSCETLRVLATSREPLRIAGERVYRIGPLETPSSREQLSIQATLSFPSIALFVDRAQAANTTFTYDDVSAPAVAAICRRLDGMALAIELAASRTAALPPQQIFAQLENHFGILHGGRRTSVRRQQTVHETIHWSYDRLHVAEQWLFRHVGVFTSGFTLTGASAMMGAKGSAAASTLDLLTSLVDKSLVVAEIHGEATRFRLLEPMRQFALEMLEQAAEMKAARQLFAQWCLEFTKAAHENWARSPTPLWFADVEPEMGNLRSCLVWALHECNDVELGQRLIAFGRRIWGRLSPYEGADWLNLAKRLTHPQTPASVHAALALAEAHLHVALQQYNVVIRAVGEFERLTDEADGLLLAEARCFAGLALIRLGRSTEGERLLAESISVYFAHGAEQLAATGITDLACAHLTRDDLKESRRLFNQAGIIFRKLGNQRGSASVAANLAETEYADGNIELAIELCRDALATSSSGREARVFLSNLAAYLVRAGRYDEARARARESLTQPGLARADVDVALAIQHLSAIAVLRTKAPSANDELVITAARLLGFVNRLLEAFGITRLSTEAHEYALLVETFDTVFETERLADLLSEGGIWDTDDAVDEALRI